MYSIDFKQSNNFQIVSSVSDSSFSKKKDKNDNFSLKCVWFKSLELNNLQLLLKTCIDKLSKQNVKIHKLRKTLFTFQKSFYIFSIYLFWKLSLLFFFRIHNKIRK